MLVDPFGRAITYLRLSVTDRCDLRCRYCMAEDMTFLPKARLLSLEELTRLGRVFMTAGIRRIRLTGGEPLVRRDVMTLIRALGEEVAAGRLEELTLTTNGTQLARHAAALAAAGVRRLNVSLDTLDPGTYGRLTRGGRLAPVLAGIEAARHAGLRIKINAVALREDNADHLPDLLAWCGARGLDLTLIESMPVGEGISGRADSFLPLTEVFQTLSRHVTLVPEAAPAGAGPARLWRVQETGTRLGFITPLSSHFCEGCNRVRVTCTGRLYQCLGQEESVDLRVPLRDHPGDDAPVLQALRDAIARKPRGHDFGTDGVAAVARHMSHTGG